MTTTHTFQGLNADGKPSSRVLNPPGGSSSNIFGGLDEPQQRTPIRNNPDNVNRGNNDIFGQGQNAAAGPQQKSRAPRSGDDSFHTLFGNYQTSLGSDKASSDNRVSSPVSGVQSQRFEQPQRSYFRSVRKSPDTHQNLFGEEGVERRKMFRSVLNNHDDSFTRLFGHSSINESTVSKSKTLASSDSTQHVNSLKSEGSPSVSTVSSNRSSNSSISNPVSRESMMKDQVVSSSSVSQSFGNFDITPRRRRRVSDRGAFNPITGEAYDQPQPKQEPLTPARSSSGSASSRTETVASGPLETSEPPTSDPVSSQEKSEPADENRSKSTDQEKPQPIDQEQPQPTDQEQLQPAAEPVPAQTAQQKRHQQQQSGVFGGTEDVKEHRSTRVSQPPGGRSTKLW